MSKGHTDKSKKHVIKSLVDLKARMGLSGRRPINKWSKIYNLMLNAKQNILGVQYNIKIIYLVF